MSEKAKTKTKAQLIAVNNQLAKELLRLKSDQLIEDQYKTYIPAGDQIIDVIPQEFTVDNFQNIPKLFFFLLLNLLI